MNKGFGINNFKTINDITELNTRDTKVNSQSKESAVFKIEQTGLYEILYLDKKETARPAPLVADAVFFSVLLFLIKSLRKIGKKQIKKEIMF